MSNNKKLYGGKCPENKAQGFYQKTGQCWLDSIQMALLHGGTNSNLIMMGLLTANNDDMLQNTLIYNKIINNNKMIPINIGGFDYGRFITNGTAYLKNIKTRLKYNLIKVENQIEKSTNTTFKNILETPANLNWSEIITFCDESDHPCERGLLEESSSVMPPPPHLSRERSYFNSIKCDTMIKTLLEINNIKYISASEDNMDKYIPGASIYGDLWLISFYNFLFMNENRYIQPITVEIPPKINHIILKEDILNECFAIIISFRLPDINKPDTYVNHVVCLFECNNIDATNNITKSGWLYDNEGIIFSDEPLKQMDWKSTIKENNYELKLSTFFSSAPYIKNIENTKIFNIILLFDKYNIPFNRTDYYLYESDYVNKFYNSLAKQLFTDIIKKQRSMNIMPEDSFKLETFLNMDVIKREMKRDILGLEEKAKEEQRLVPIGVKDIKRRPKKHLASDSAFVQESQSVASDSAFVQASVIDYSELLKQQLIKEAHDLEILITQIKNELQPVIMSASSDVLLPTTSAIKRNRDDTDTESAQVASRLKLSDSESAQVISSTKEFDDIDYQAMIDVVPVESPIESPDIDYQAMLDAVPDTENKYYKYIKYKTKYLNLLRLLNQKD